MIIIYYYLWNILIILLDLVIPSSPRNLDGASSAMGTWIDANGGWPTFFLFPHNGTWMCPLFDQVTSSNYRYSENFNNIQKSYRDSIYVQLAGRSFDSKSSSDARHGGLSCGRWNRNEKGFGDPRGLLEVLLAVELEPNWWLSEDASVHLEPKTCHHFSTSRPSAIGGFQYKGLPGPPCSRFPSPAKMLPVQD